MKKTRKINTGISENNILNNNKAVSTSIRCQVTCE